MGSDSSTTRLSHDQIVDLLAGKTVSFRTADGQVVSIQGPNRPDPVPAASIEKRQVQLAAHGKVELFNASMGPIPPQRTRRK